MFIKNKYYYIDKTGLIKELLITGGACREVFWRIFKENYKYPGHLRAKANEGEFLPWNFIGDFRCQR